MPDTVAVVLSGPKGTDWPTIIAGLAVLVTLISLLVSNHQTKKELRALRDTKRAQLSAKDLRHRLGGLLDDLAEYLANSHHVYAGFRQHQAQGTGWPGEYREYWLKEDLLYNRVCLQLDPSDSDEDKVLKKLKTLREGIHQKSDDPPWIDLRDDVLKSFQALYSKRWHDTFLALEDHLTNA